MKGIRLATLLDKVLKRQVTVDGADYTVVIDPDGLRLIAKGRRKPEVDLRWHDLLSGEAALATALNASLSSDRRGTSQPADGLPETLPVRAGKRSPVK